MSSMKVIWEMDEFFEDENKGKGFLCGMFSSYTILLLLCHFWYGIFSSSTRFKFFHMYFFLLEWSFFGKWM